MSAYLGFAEPKTRRQDAFCQVDRKGASVETVVPHRFQGWRQVALGEAAAVFVDDQRVVQIVRFGKVEQDLAIVVRDVLRVAEADAQRADWRLVFIAALGGRAGRPPAAADTDRALATMEDGIRQGRVQAYLVLGRDGRPLELG